MESNRSELRDMAITQIRYLAECHIAMHSMANNYREEDEMRQSLVVFNWHLVHNEPISTNYFDREALYRLGHMMYRENEDATRPTSPIVREGIALLSEMIDHCASVVFFVDENGRSRWRGTGEPITEIRAS